MDASIPITLQNAKDFASLKFRSLPKDVVLAILQAAKMDDEFPQDEAAPVDYAANHLKAWREFRGLTQEQLAEKVGTSGSVISLLESGGRKLSPKWLRQIAPHLSTTPGMLLEHDPADIPADVLDAWSAIPEAKRPDAMAMLKALAGGKS